MKTATATKATGTPPEPAPPMRYHYRTISNRIADSSYSQTERDWMHLLGFGWTGGDATSNPLITTTKKARQITRL